MYATAEEIHELLDPWVSGVAEVSTHPLPGDEAPVVQINGLSYPEASEVLDRLQDLAEQTRRWPLLSIDHEVDPYRFEERQFRRYVVDGELVTPTAIAERSLLVDIDQQIVENAERRDDYLLENFVLEVEEEPDRFHLPDDLDPGEQVHEELQAAIDEGKVSTTAQARRWVFDWKVDCLDDSAEAIAKTQQIHLDYRVDVDRAKGFPILLLAVSKAESWRVTSFKPWFDKSGEFATALLKRWSERWGATPISHHGMAMSFVVERPPETLAHAAALAWEHYSLAPGTTELPCIDLALYARALVGYPRWHLHDKP